MSLENNYQPNLILKKVDVNITSNAIKKIMDKLNYGEIERIIIVFSNKQYNNVIVIFKKWNIHLTYSTRLLLNRGKYLTIYYNDTQFWKVYEHSSRKRVNNFSHK